MALRGISSAAFGLLGSGRFIGYDAVMTIVLHTTQSGNGAATQPFTDVMIHISARVVTADQARRTVNGWLCLEVGDRLLAGEPELLVGEQLLWRVPVQWTSPTQGVLAANIDQVLVDAATGKAIISPTQAQELQTRVETLARSLHATIA